jgi:tRNA 2-thiocytidine biosynthesis protein TtcA
LSLPLSARENRRIAQAMLDYQMLAQDDRILIAVSGGIDSLILAWLLNSWQYKTPIRYTVQAVHVDMQPQDGGPGQRAKDVAAALYSLGLSCTILPGDPPLSSQDTAKITCHRCARNRRRQLFEYARQGEWNKLALGHHRDDLVETFFINLTSGGNISTMRPKQDLFSGRFALIRPLAYLVKEDILAIGKRLAVEAIPSNCPLADVTRRTEIRSILNEIYQRIPKSRQHLFAALGNVRNDYLLLQEKRTHANPS